MPRKSEILKALELRRDELIEERKKNVSEFMKIEAKYEATQAQLGSELDSVFKLISVAKPNTKEQ